MTIKRGRGRSEFMTLEIEAQDADLQLWLTVDGQSYSIAWEQAARLQAALSDALAMALERGALPTALGLH